MSNLCSCSEGKRVPRDAGKNCRHRKSHSVTSGARDCWFINTDFGCSHCCNQPGPQDQIYRGPESKGKSSGRDLHSSLAGRTSDVRCIFLTSPFVSALFSWLKSGNTLSRGRGLMATVSPQGFNGTSRVCSGNLSIRSLPCWTEEAAQSADAPSLTEWLTLLWKVRVSHMMPYKQEPDELCLDKIIFCVSVRVCVCEGASVISSRCSQTYTSPSGCLTLFGIPLWSLFRSPRTAIQVSLKSFTSPPTLLFPLTSLPFSPPRVPPFWQVPVGVLWGQRGHWPSRSLTRWRSHTCQWTTCRATTPPLATSNLPLKTSKSTWVRRHAENGPAALSPDCEWPPLT